MRSHEAMLTSGVGKEPWCKCPPKKNGGPYVAPPDVIVRYTFESKDAAAFRERCRLASNSERRARDAITDARYTPKLRRRRDSSPIVKAAVKAYRAALRELEALQAVCPHESRSMFNRVFCDVCSAHVECDVEHFRHCVREGGKRWAMRLAV
jgi:hypothetical protein